MDSPSSSPDSSDFLLADGDVRAIVRLLSEIAVHPGSLDQKRIKLMEGLCKLIQADAWLWGATPSLIPGEQPVYLYHHIGGFTPERLSKHVQAVEHPDAAAMTAPFATELADTGTHLTRLRQQIISDERFHSSPSHPLWEKSGIGPLILSYRPLGNGVLSSVGIYRFLGAPEFTARESKIVHILLTEVDWLHEEGLPIEQSRSLPSLPPRCRIVFTHLLHGRSRKDIATDLSLSVHTVNDYVKTIFRRMGVRSIHELVSRFRAGDGRDTP